MDKKLIHVSSELPSIANIETRPLWWLFLRMDRLALLRRCASHLQQTPVFFPVTLMYKQIIVLYEERTIRSSYGSRAILRGEKYVFR